MITESIGVITPNPANLPPELAARPQWVVWKLEQPAGRDSFTKVPYSTDGYPASTTDLLSWSPFERAWDAYEDSGGEFQGVGFCFSSADPYTFIDMDRCRNPRSGRIAKWAREMIAEIEEYAHVEISVSGTGIHAVLEGKVRGGGIRRGKLEMYSRDRFACMSGVLL